jgi:hypothetical protein
MSFSCTSSYFGLSGKRGDAQRKLPPWCAGRSHHSRRRGQKTGFGDCIHAEGSRKPATSCFLLLPPASPRTGGGEAKTAPKGRS